MNASKENCGRAIDAMSQWPGSSAAKTIVFEFLQAAMKRLPNEKSIEKDRQRRRTTKA